LIESALSDRRSGVDAVSGERTDTEDEQATSVLVSEPAFDVLLVDGERMGVEVEPVKTTVTTYEYTLAERLGSDEEYAKTLESRYRFAVTGLSDDERHVVDEAVAEGGYYASSTDDGRSKAWPERSSSTNRSQVPIAKVTGSSPTRERRTSRCSI